MDESSFTVLFDVDGTLVESEQTGHRVAFNEAFRRAGLEDRWNTEVYRELLAVTGGQRRLQSWFDRQPESVDGLDDQDVVSVCQRLHEDKTNIFIEMCRSGAVDPRPGVHRLISELREQDVTLGIATTGRRSWVEPLINSLFGENTFEFMVTGDDVAKLKPNPEVYMQCLAHDKCAATRVLAVEDSIPGLTSAVRAGIPCVLVANEDTADGGRSEATLALTGYGDTPDTRVTSDPFGLCPAGTLTAEVLRSVADRRPRRAEADVQ